MSSSQWFDQAREVFVSRHMYNLLVQEYGRWMECEYPKLDRKWSVAGVLCSTRDPGLLFELTGMIERIQKLNLV